MTITVCGESINIFEHLGRRASRGKGSIFTGRRPVTRSEIIPFSHRLLELDLFDFSRLLIGSGLPFGIVFCRFSCFFMSFSSIDSTLFFP